MKLRKYSESQLREAVKNSLSIRQALLTLGVQPYGGNYAVIKKAISFYKIDASHFLGQAANKGKRFTPKRELSDYLSNKFPIQSNKLRLRLLKEGVFSHQCSSCLKTEWLGNPIPLELDHVNGDNQNNNLKNLRLLCPNCHALTPTYRGRNQKLSSGLPSA